MAGTLTEVVSGGQTGVDRAGLDAAIFLNVPHGGWCPLGRRSERGRIPPVYQLKETDSRNYAVRTEQNVIDSDGTLILYKKAMSRGTELTAKFTRRHRRPMLDIDLADFGSWDESRFENEVVRVADWIESENINVLNIAGPRESTCPGIGKTAQGFLVRVFERSV
jgi:hypothetical protein